MRRKSQHQKTWAKFKAFFATECLELKEINKATEIGHCYFAANILHKQDIEDSLIGESLQHLTLAVTTDKNTMPQLVEANAKLTNNVTTLTTKLA